MVGRGVNAELVEAVLSYSSLSGPARLLLATMAALADEAGVVRDLSTEHLCAASGLTDRTYRRARQALLASGELVLVIGTGARRNTNVWTVPDPRQFADRTPARTTRRVPPPAGASPLVATASSSNGKGGQDRTVSGEKCPIPTGVLVVKGGQDRTLFELPTPETRTETPAETPAAYARAGSEPQNPRTQADPQPLQGGVRPTRSSSSRPTSPITVKRRRTIRIDLAEVRRGLGVR